MKKSFIPLFLVGLLAIATVNPAFGFGKKKKATPPEKHETVISSVTANSITISENKVAKTFTVTQFTEITLNGQRGTLADLKPGMNVTVTMGTDPTRASRITASGKK